MKKITLLFAIIFIVLSLWQINTSKTWESHGQFIILGKGEAEKNTINQITENILFFPYKIANVQLNRIGNSGIIEITARGNDKSSSEYLLEDSFRSIFLTISKIYNIKTALNLRVIEKEKAHSDVLYTIKKAFLLKIIVSLLISFLLLTLARKVRSNKNISNTIKSNKVFQKTSTQEKKTESPKESKNKPQKTNIAPENLPLAGDEIEKMFGAVSNGRGYKIEYSSKKQAEEDKPIKEELIKEASPEEVKERLNKLLGSIK